MAMVLDALVSAVMEKLLDKAIEEIVSALGVKSETKKLQRSIESIRSLLVDAKSKKIEDNSINLWLAKLREVMYDVEDLLDDCQVEADKNVAAAGDTSYSWIASLPSVPGLSQLIFSVAFRNEILTRIEEMNSTLERLTSQTLILQLLANLPNAEREVSRYNSSRITDTCSFQLDSEIVGIDDDATGLVDQITGDSNREHSVFAIAGLGGIGKATLARKVFNHHLIQNHFNKNTVWVCVSGNCSGEYLLKEIVRFFDKNYSESRVSLNELSSKLMEVVKEKRVFIVLDDVWDSRVWEEFLRVPLHTGAKHSRILITTRNQQVAMKMNAAWTHLMTAGMNPSDGWSMLCKIVFEEKDNDMNELADVGKQIVDKCKGLPLAIKVVGGVLRMSDRTIAAWRRVLSSTTWSMQDLRKNLLPSLLLSYEDLPLHLKQCFTYCSLFPADHVISRYNLEHLWIAEGFIKKEEGKDVEYFARDCYNELVMRNFLQADGPFHCKMHDLLRSFAIFVSQNQYIYLQPEDFHNRGLTRRHYLSFVGNDTKVVSQEIKEEDRVRTLLLSRNPRITMVSSELLSSLRRLRVLDLQGTGIETLPDSLGTLIHLRFLNISDTYIRELSDSIGALIHLRFLDISSTKLRELPDSIKNLKNLETLEATRLSHLRSLPMGISELFNLRCLRVDQLDNMPIGLGNLKNLRVLDCFVVNERTSSTIVRWPRKNYKPNMRELKDLSQLTDLSIYNIERVSSKELAEEAAIEKKTNLESLTLSWDHESDESSKKIEEVFAGIKLPENLMDLRIYGFFGKQLPDHMTSDHLRQLISLELRNCKSLTRLPSLGDMPKLQRLEIVRAESVVELGTEFLGSLKFPKLQKLELGRMSKLERMFDAEEGGFPCLVKLSISYCPKLNSLGEGLNHATCLKMLNVHGVENLVSIENLTSISDLAISDNKTLSSVKKLPSLKNMSIVSCGGLEDVNEVGELNDLYIFDMAMKTLPRWLKSITPPKKLYVVGIEELVLRTQQSFEDQNFIKKCLYAEVRSLDGSKYISYRKDHLRYNSNSTVMRNLLQVFDMENDSTYCKMHDLLRSLAIFVSQNQYIYLQPDDFHKNGLTRRHHLSFIGNDMNDELVSQEIKEEDRVRTLLLSDNPRITIVSSELLNSLRRLRVLDLQGTGIEALPDSLGDLIHLKFLHISCTGDKELKLPDSIRKLKNLEILVVVRLNKMPNGLDNMKNLRILHEFVVNDRTSSRGRPYTPNLKELKDLSQLTLLSISNLERVASKEEAQEAAIEKKTRLESLSLGCDLDQRRSASDEDIKKIEEVFAGIRIPENLTNLWIVGFFGKQLPDHMTSDRLRQLTSLDLISFRSLTRLPSLGDLPKLQILKIDGLDSVVELGSEFLGSLKFPKLQELELDSMWKLERMFDVEEGAFPCLVKLFIRHCSKLNSLGEGWNHATCLETLDVKFVRNLKSIENLTSIYRLSILQSRLKYVKNLPSLKRMRICKCPALEDVNEVGELDILWIENEVAEIKNLPRWLENITPPKKLYVDNEELVLGIHYNSKSTGSSGASSSSVTIT